MFSLREFLMTGFRGAVGKMPDYQVIMNAAGYYEKNVLTTGDLAELQSLIDEKNASAEVAVESSDGAEDSPEGAEV